MNWTCLYLQDFYFKRLVENRGEAKPGDGELAVERRADRREIVGAERVVHVDVGDRDLAGRLVRLQRPVDRRSRAQRRNVLLRDPVVVEIVGVLLRWRHVAEFEVEKA